MAPSADSSSDEKGPVKAVRSRLPRWHRVMRKMLIIMLSIYISLLGLLVLAEPYLVYPSPPTSSGDWNLEHFDAEDVHFSSSDGTSLHGLLFKHKAPKFLILFCHGNGEHVGYSGREMRQHADRLGATVLSFDYRGYGKSKGSPYEAGVLADAEAALDELKKQQPDQPLPVIVWGRSLGGGVACHLAAEKEIDGLILYCTFSRMTDTAARHYPFVPIRMLMRNRYDSLARLKKYDKPLLQVHGTADRIVPFDLGKTLFESAGSEQKRFIERQGFGHNNLETDHDEVAEFLQLVADDLGE